MTVKTKVIIKKLGGVYYVGCATLDLGDAKFETFDEANKYVEQMMYIEQVEEYEIEFLDGPFWRR